MKKNILSLLLIFSAGAFVLQGCLNEVGEIPQPPETHCDSLNVSYNMDVKPIVQNKCAVPGCHDGGGGAPHDFNLYDNLSGVSNTVSVRIQLPVTDGLRMPLSGDLTAEELDILLCWIDDGAPNN